MKSDSGKEEKKLMGNFIKNFDSSGKRNHERRKSEGKGSQWSIEI